MFMVLRNSFSFIRSFYTDVFHIKCTFDKPCLYVWDNDCDLNDQRWKNVGPAFSPFLHAPQPFSSFLHASQYYINTTHYYLQWWNIFKVSPICKNKHSRSNCSTCFNKLSMKHLPPHGKGQNLNVPKRHCEILYLKRMLWVIRLLLEHLCSNLNNCH